MRLRGFDLVANEYDDWYKTPLGRFVDEVEKKLAFDMVPLTKGMRILDLGCGTGIYTSLLKDHECKVTGIDLSDKMLEIARAKFPDIHFIQSNIYALPFPDNKFDLVFSMATFEFIEELEMAYYEIRRVVKPGGKIFIGTINGDSAWGELYKPRKDQENSVFKNAFFKTPEILKAVDNKNLINLKGCLFFPPDTPPEQLNWGTENKLSSNAKPGFIGALWKKEDI